MKIGIVLIIIAVVLGLVGGYKCYNWDVEQNVMESYTIGIDNTYISFVNEEGKPWKI